MLRGIYDWTMRMAASERAPWALAVVSFVESSFFPIPPDVMLIPMVLSRREKAWWYATIATVASVIGGLLGYAIGYYLYDAVGAADPEILWARARARQLHDVRPRLRRAGRHHQGHDADSLQGRDDRGRGRPNELAGVHRGEHRRARDAFLSGRRCSYISSASRSGLSSRSG